MKLLLIEDDPGDAYLFEEKLADVSADVTVTCVATAAAGLSAVTTEPPDIVVADLSLPDSVGLETVSHFTGDEQAVPLIVLTGNTDSDLGVAAVAAGAQDFLVKDTVSGDLLLKTIQFAIQRGKLQARLEQANATLAATNRILQDTLEQVKTLRGLLPICMYCKNIRGDQGYWESVDSYLCKHTEADFTHGICPDCLPRAISASRSELNGE